MKVYIYVTKGGKGLYRRSPESKMLFGEEFFLCDRKKVSTEPLNGKVVASFELGEVENLSDGYAGKHKDAHFYEILNKACLTTDQLEKYCPEFSDKRAYAWHIENLEVLDEPWGFGSFASVDTSYPGWQSGWERDGITKAPQSWMYAIAYYSDDFGEPCVLLSVRSEWACKILNGEKTVEIRKSAPKDGEA